MFISREVYLKLFHSIDQTLQDIALESIKIEDLVRIFGIDCECAKNVKSKYPSLIEVHRIIYNHYKNQHIVWENKKRERFVLTYAGNNNNKSKNRWHEFKMNMGLIQKSQN